MLVRTLVMLSLVLSACGGDDDDGNVDPDAGAGTDAAPPDAEPDPVIVCEAEIPAAADGVCDVTAGETGAVLLRGTVLGAPTVYENGSVLIDSDGTIACVGCDCSGEAAFDGAARVDCAAGAISPALINPHDHMTFSEGAPIDHGTTRYDHRHDWRGSLSAPQNAHGTGQNSDGMRWVEIRQVMGGTVTLIGSGWADGMLRNLDRAGGDEGLTGTQLVRFDTFPLGDSGEQFRADCSWGYREDELDVAGYPAYLPHVAEGITMYAAEEFRCESTSFDGGRDFTESNTAHIHAIGLTSADYYRMALDDAQIIWSPRSNIDLYGHTADVVTFDRFGGTVALGTDWSYSGSIHSGRELACADEYNRNQLDGYFTDRELWEMATINASRVIATQDRIGSLEAGKVADITVFRGAASHHRAAIDAGATDVLLVLRAGEPLYGEADVVTGLGQSCETLDVCGETRALCAAREFGGTDFATIAAAVDGAYPAFFCDTPTSEPSCVPARPGEFTGVPSAGDADGDGIADGDDNCPRVFNPLRALWGSTQPDADGDGLGDPCDDTPLPADLDGDTVANAADNCPFDANTPQDDGDADGKGDTCDFCPDVANPGGVCPEAPPVVTSITDIQTGTIATGTRVTIEDVVVTGVGANVVTVQDPAAATATNSGVMVFLATVPTLAVGDVVDVVGDTSEYFDNTEIDNATATPTGAQMSIAPTDVTVAMAATEPYEGVLVRLTDGTVTDTAFDCSVTPPCVDANLWEVDGASGVLVYDRLYEDADFVSHIGELPVTGVMMYRFDRRRLMPRTAADF
jgi:cytosine/adenosine deaminase-related metal-dependent hydrolase